MISPITHVPDLWVFWSQLHGVSVFSATGTAAKGQTRSSLATAQSVHPHLLPKQSLLTHTGTICMLLQPKPNAGEMSSDFCTSDLHSVCSLIFCLSYISAVLWNISQLFGFSCLEHLLLLRRQFKSQ